MKKYLIAGIIALVANTAAALPLYSKVTITGYTCQKENINAETNYANGIGGAAYTFDWYENTTENVNVEWDATRTPLLTAAGAVRGSLSGARIILQHAIVIGTLTSKGIVNRRLPAQVYEAGLGNGTRMINSNNWINVSHPGYKLQFWTAGGTGRLTISLPIDGVIKNHHLTCTAKYGW